MAYFNYHAKIKQKILAGELQKYYFDKNYKSIGFALVLCFGTKKYPVRENMFLEYFELIGQNYDTQQSNEIFFTIFKKNIV